MISMTFLGILGLLAMAIMIGLLILFPQIALFLPETIVGR